MTDEPQQDKRVNKFDLDWWVKHRERAIQNRWYAIGRIDLLVISISGGGIYIAFEIMKFVIEKQLTVDTGLLKTSGLLFTIAMAFNFVSQVFGLNANKFETKWSAYKILETRKKPCDYKKMGSIDFRVSICNWGVVITNNLSIITMITGVLLLIIFSYNKL